MDRSKDNADDWEFGSGTEDDTAESPAAESKESTVSAHDIDLVFSDSIRSVACFFPYYCPVWFAFLISLDHRPHCYFEGV